MKTDLERLKPCASCSDASVESHGAPCQSNEDHLVGAPSFLKMIHDKHLANNAGFVRLPSAFMEQHGPRIGNVVTLKGPSGWVGQASVSNDEGFGFCGGWKQFVVHHNIGAGDYVVCTLIADSKFSVKIYNKFGCERVYPFHALTPDGSKVHLPISKPPEGGREFAPTNLGGKRKTLDEVKSLSGIGKKLCMQQLGLERSMVEDGNVEIETKLHIASDRFGLKSDHNPDPQQNVGTVRASTPVQVGSLSEDSSSSESEKRSVEMEEIDDVDNYNEAIVRKRVHRAVYETEMRRFMAMEAAQAYETANPRTMLVVNKTAITKSQSYFSSVFARKWFPEERAQLLLIDDADNKWAVTFIPTASHMVLGAGWAKFVRDNKLEKGDVVVFELKNPNTLTLIVHIFRVKDYTFVRVANLGRNKHPDSSTVYTPSKTENLSGNARVKHTVESREDDQSPGTSDVTELKSQPSMAPQYVAVAKYFANRASPPIHGNQKVCESVAHEIEPRKANETNSTGEECGIIRHVGESFTVSKQGLQFLMPGSQSRVTEETLLELNDKTSASSTQQNLQTAAPFTALQSGISEIQSLYSPAKHSPQLPQSLLTQKEQIGHGMPAHLGGTAFLTPQVQKPCATQVQDSTNIFKLQQVQPLETLRLEESYPGVAVPPGLPKEVEFPKIMREDPPARPRERWEIKPRRPRPPTDAERQRAVDEASDLWTPNPHVMVVLKPSQVYAGFSLTLRCAALPDETRDATLVDSTGQTWMCKWLVNHSGRRLSAGWKRFAVDHLLEEGDVCIFEMIDRINLTLLIHIFRIELDDHIAEPIEIRKSVELRRPPADPTKRKRKSRAKPKGLGPPVPKLPAYSGCRMEKLGGSNPLSRGANVLPNMPSYKYTALQSRRRPVTMEERRRTELGARNLNTKNPSVTVVMRNSSVYCHFLVSIPSAFAKQWLPRKLVRVTLVDSGGQRSTARWAGNRKKSACLKSFREFSLSHCLEEGDALVFELMDPNPSNPVFLVHVFRVVELPSTRISPKDWETHYKLDVMIGTMKPVVPLQAYQRRYDGQSRMLQAYQPLSSGSEDEQDEPSGLSMQPAMLSELSPKSKTKAIYSALVKRKTISNKENGNSDRFQHDLGEGTSRTVEKLAHTAQGQTENYADKSTHIFQLERLGRQQISRDIMPILKRNPGVDSHGHEAIIVSYTNQAHREPVEQVHDKPDLKVGFRAAHVADDTSQNAQNIKLQVSKTPKQEPVEEVSPPKESKKTRRKTTQRREGRDDFLQVAVVETSNWELQDLNLSRPKNIEVSDVFRKTLLASEPKNGGSQALGSSTHEPEILLDANAPRAETLSTSKNVSDNKRFISGSNYQDETGMKETGRSVRNQKVSIASNQRTLDKVRADRDEQWLKPKSEPVHGGDTVLGLRCEGGSCVESGQLEEPRPGEENEGLVKDDTTTQFKQVFFGSVIEGVRSKVGAHNSDAERRRLCHMERLTPKSRDHVERWQFLQPGMVVNPNADKTVQSNNNNNNNNRISWFNHPSRVGQAGKSQASATWEKRWEK